MARAFSLLITWLLFHTQSHSQIEMGDIAFLGFNADNADQFSIICCNYIEDGIPLFFTDAGWDGSAFYGPEGHIEWTVPAGGLPAGSIITFTGGTSGGFTVFGTGDLESGVSVTAGTISATASTSSMALSTDGDQIFIYTGSIASPSFIAGVNFNGGWSFTAPNLSQQSQIPAGLSVGIDCILLPDRDNQQIDCTLLPDPATASDYNNSTNWIYNDVSRFALPPDAMACDLLLPVEMVSFYAVRDLDLITLHWSTLSEINTNEFRVQRSTNGSDFFVVGSVTANGSANTPSDYSFTDDAPISAGVYYRLQILDHDGFIDYSNTIFVDGVAGLTGLRAFPNPSNGSFELQFETGVPGRIEVLNPEGRLVYSRNMENGADNKKVILPAGNPDGVYCVVVYTSDVIMKTLVIISKSPF